MTDFKSTLGPRGRKCGPRGPRGPRGHAGPGGPATSLVGPTEGPGALVADEDIPEGFVVSGNGSAVLAISLNPSNNRVPKAIGHDCITCFRDARGNLFCSRCSDCLINPETDEYECPMWPIGLASQHAEVGQTVRYVAAGPLELPTARWDVVTGGTGGLVPHLFYYLSQTQPGRLTTNPPRSGQAIKIGVAISSKVLDVNIESGQTDGFTLVGRGSQIPTPFSVMGYGFAGGSDFEGRNDAAWQLAAAGILPGTPIAKNLVDGASVVGQQLAFAGAWLTSHVIGLSTPGVGQSGGMEQGKFVSGGLFEMAEAEWDAVWTASDPNRGSGSGLIPGYPYYLSDIPGTSYLINKTGVPPVIPGNWLTKCFVALSSTYVLIQIGDPTSTPA